MPPQQFVNNRGFVALTSVIILGAVGVIIATTFLMIGFSMERTNVSNADAAKARGFAMACAEKGLLTIYETHEFNGNETLEIDTGTCNFNIEPLENGAGAIQAIGFSNNTIRKVLITLTTSTPPLTNYVFQEVGDF